MSRTWELFAVTHLQEKKKKACVESPLSIVELESEQWTVHSPHQTQLENKKACSPHPQEKKGGPFTSQCGFSLVA